jgi:hypothetical protein
VLIFTSVPKSGTHLVRAALERLLGPAGPPLAKSAPWRPRSPWTFCAHVRHQGQPLPDHARVLVLVRDPRALVLSIRDHLTGPHGREVAPASVIDILQRLSFEEQLQTVAGGVWTPSGKLAPIEQHCAGFDWPRASFVRYEDLFTPGGAAALQPAMPQVPLERIREALEAVIGANTPTLNVGDPDRWRAVLPLELVRLIETRAGEVMARWGYRRGRRAAPAPMPARLSARAPSCRPAGRRAAPGRPSPRARSADVPP